MSAFLIFVQVFSPLVAIVTYAAPTQSVSAGGSPSLDPVANKATRLSGQGSSGVDQSTGALTYSYPLSLPAGRNGVAPTLALSYNSQNTENGWFGYGWNLSIPYIEITNKNGSDKLYTNKTYTSSLHGELVSYDGTNYEQKVDDGSFARYTLQGTSWQMTDRDGTTYYFGTDAYSRLQNDNGTKVGRWYLASVKDKFGNGITYNYSKDGNLVYPTSISYTEHILAHPLNLVTFTTEDRADKMVSYKYGFKTTENKRISALKVATNGADAVYVDFSYAVGANKTRSMLATIEESRLGSNGDWATLPKTTFEYENSPVAFSGSISLSSNPMGSNSVIDTNADGIQDLYSYGDGYYPVDIDGDFRKDFMLADVYYSPVGGTNFITYAYNTGATVQTFNKRLMVYSTTGTNIISMPMGLIAPFMRSALSGEPGPVVRSTVTDVNGDGFDDILYTDPTVGNGVGVNTTSNSFVYGANAFSIDVNNEQLADIDGDGLLDKVSKSYTATSTLYNVYLNNGTGYETTAGFQYDAKIASNTYDNGVRFLDVNNDGLVDVVRAYSSSASGGSCALPQTVNEVRINTGSSFATSTYQMPGYLVNYSACATGLFTKEYDNNGNGTADYDSASNNTSKQDVLKKVTSSLGATLDIAYKWSTATGLNPGLPVPMYIVDTTTDKRTASDAAPHIVSYTFSSGSMYFDVANPKDHRFAGFGKVDVVDGKNKTITYFHQGNGDNYTTGEKGDSVYAIGRPFRVDTFDTTSGSDVLKSKALSLYKTYSLASSTFTYLDSQVSNLYNQDGSWVSQATSQVYDASKRLIKSSTDWGDVASFNSFASSTITDAGTDLIYTTYQYSNSRPQRLVRQTKTDYASTTIENSTFYYDGLPFGLADAGAMTTVAALNLYPDGTTQSIATTTTTYDATGNVTQTKDALGNTTKIYYDAGYFFPLTKVNALNGTTTTVYDTVTLTPVSSKGPDGITSVQYNDGFGKTTRTYALNTSGGVTNDTKTSYLYGGGVLVYTQRTNTSTSSPRSVQAYDSFGRLVQSKSEVTPDVFMTQDTAYDAQSNVISSSLPYTSSGYGQTSPTPTNGSVVYSYDGLGRTTSKSTGNNTVTYTYNTRSMVATDNASSQHKRGYIYDARGNLAQVDEYNGGQKYSTFYGYTPLGKLSRITDANGNVRSFNYLSSGVLTYQEDPHAPTDATFTTYSYTYDLLGRLTKKTGPLGSLSYTYDTISRPLTRVVTDINNPTSTTTLTYTGCSNTYTSPCTINRGTSSTTYAYTVDGRLSSETLRMDGNVFTRSYLYDAIGNPTSITHPDGGKSLYSYGLDGNQTSLTYVTPSGVNKVVAKDATFNSFGAMSSLKYGNNVYQCNTYTSSSTDGTITPHLGKSVYLFNTTGCSAPSQNTIELYKDEFTYKDSFTPSNVLSTYKDIAGTTHTKNDSYTYDNLMRLTQVNTSYDGGASQVNNLVYDPIGNLIQENDVLYKYSVDGRQNAHAVTSIGGTHISYDAQGNRTQVGGDMYGWNTLNQMTRATSSTNGTEVYTYDESGERIKKVVTNTTLINQKVTPATSVSALVTYKANDLFNVSTSSATTTTVVATSTYNKLNTLSLATFSKVYTLVNGYYTSPFTAQYCSGATTTSARNICVASTTEQLVANDLAIKSGTTTMTAGFVVDMMQIAKGLYQIPVTYTGLPNASTTIAKSATSTYTISSSTVSAYSTYVATGLVTPLVLYDALPYISTSTYQTLSTIGLASTAKTKVLFSYAGCTATSTACATAMKVVFEKYYKNNGKLLSNKDLNEMWYVFAGKARVPTAQSDYATSSLVLTGLTPPVISSITTTTATTTYYTNLFFTTEYNAQIAKDPRLVYFSTIPYLITQSAYSRVQSAGITQATLENYTVLIRELLAIPVASSTEYMYALKQFAYRDKGVTLTDADTKELYVGMLGAAIIPSGMSDYSLLATFDLTSNLIVASYIQDIQANWNYYSSACRTDYFNWFGSNSLMRCSIGSTPFTLPVSASATVRYELGINFPPTPQQNGLYFGKTSYPVYSGDINNRLSPGYPSIYQELYPSTTLPDNSQFVIDVTSTVSLNKIGSTTPRVVVLNSQEGTGFTGGWQAQVISLKAFATTPQQTLASTTILSFATSTAQASVLTSIQTKVAAYFAEISDSATSIPTGFATSSMVSISNESAIEFASTTLQDAYDISRVFNATATPWCVSNASTTECDKTARKAFFRTVITNLAGFTPSQAATEEFWMVHKGVLALPPKSYINSIIQSGYWSSTTTYVQGMSTTSVAAFYSFASNSSSSVGTLHGATVNSPTYSAGKIGNAFTSSSSLLQYASMPNGVMPWGTNTWSVNMWVKMNTIGGNQAWLMTARTGSGIMFYKSATNIISMGKPNVSSADYVWSGIDTNWHMWTFVADGANGGKIYLDGNQNPVATDVNTTNIINPSGDSVLVGAYSSNGTVQAGWYNDGKIDGLGIWNRAISTSEISTLYNSGSGLEYPFLVASTTSWYTASTTDFLASTTASQVFSRANLPATLGTSTVMITSTSSVPGFWATTTVLQNAPTGGTITTAGTYRIHTFTSSGVFANSSSSPILLSDVLVVGAGGGGGSGGSFMGGGGGGAGGYVASSSFWVSASTTLSVTIGAGGAGSGGGANGSSGANSVFGSLTAIGGGGGGARNASGVSGGSGGGSGGSNFSNFSGGAGSQGSNGGGTISSSNSPGAGGGGAFSQGGISYISGGQGGVGGAGLMSSISGASTTYAGGGAGGAGGGASNGVGGLGGGANGGQNSGVPNTGGGGGGGDTNATQVGGNGGSGIVIVRYPISQFQSATSTYTATSTKTTIVTHLDLVPPGLLTDAQYNSLYSTSTFARATSTVIVSEETYNELLRTPIRLNSDVDTVFDYAYPIASSTCPAQASTSACFIHTQKNIVRAVVASSSGYIVSDAALEELFRVKKNSLAIVPVPLQNATYTPVVQTVMLSLNPSDAYVSFSTTTVGTSTVLASTVGKCSLATSGASSSRCAIDMPYINSVVSSVTLTFSLSTSTVATTSISSLLSYLAQATTTSSTSSQPYSTVVSTSTFTGVKSGTSTFSFDISSLYSNYLSLLSPSLTFTPSVGSTSLVTLSTSTLSITRTVLAPAISYTTLGLGSTSTTLIPFSRSVNFPLASSTVATTTIDLRFAPVLPFSSDFLSPVGRITTTSSTTTSPYHTTDTSYYTFDGSASTTVGTYHGTTVNGATYSTGKLGSALSLAASSLQYATIPQASLPWNTNTYTINLWFKYNSTPTNGVFLNQQRSSKGLILYYSAGNLTFVTFSSPSINLPWAGDTSWHMLTVRSNASGRSFFLDGTLGASNPSASNILVTGSDPMVIGANQADGAFIPGFYFDGKIDELSITPTSLSNADIQALYNSGAGTSYVQAVPTPDYTGTYIDPTYTPLPTITYGALPAVAYPYATSSVATSTINRLTVATTTSYTVYTPLSNYVQDSRGTKTTYLTLNGTLVGVYTYQTEQEASTGKLSYVLTNYLGTPTVTTDDKGDITELGITDVFGNYKYRDTRKDAALHTKTFTGHEFDDTTGLVYAHARYLDTKAHTFLSVDPMLYSLPSSYLTDPQQMNSYAYARNNPVTTTDPDGKFINIAIGAVLGAVISGGIAAYNGASPVNIAKAAGAGFVAGGVAAATFGASLAVTGSSVAGFLFAGSASSVAGGAVNRGLTGGQVFSTQAIAKDAAFGLVGSALGYAAGKAISAYTSGRSSVPTSGGMSGGASQSGSSPGVAIPKIGDTVQFGGSSGVRIETPKGTFVNMEKMIHAPQQMTERGVSIQQVKDSVLNPGLVLQQNNKQVFFGRDATVVIDTYNGYPVTAWNFDRNAANIKQILERLLQ